MSRCHDNDKTAVKLPCGTGGAHKIGKQEKQRKAYAITFGEMLQKWYAILPKVRQPSEGRQAADFKNAKKTNELAG